MASLIKLLQLLHLFRLLRFLQLQQTFKYFVPEKANLCGDCIMCRLL